ncbi:long chain fatty acyl-CoA synthetase [Saccharomyces pastorianus]|uniref:Long chain fatty acyl-CoA synthetase n=1 Tax=Saccharomyces pastorianus TaxID=27292 RepID=A0A6C1DVI1_SACPS|nr:long chain fatty acyl-CoA synthetase [Saccharomyces pastorianus]
MSEQHSVAVGKAADEHETAPRRNVRVKKRPLIRPLNSSASTLYEFALECFNKGGKRDGMAWRDVIEIHETKKTIVRKVDGKDKSIEKTWLYYEMSPYKMMTYQELIWVMHDMGRGLAKIGIKPNGEHKFHIFASTSHKWMKIFLGCISQGIPSAAIFTDNQLLAKMIVPLQSAKDIKFLIHNEPIDPNDRRQNGKLYKAAKDAINKIREVRPDIKIYSFEEVVKIGKKSKDEVKLHPPEPKDLACIMYTSGSISAPKGVVLTHYNIVSGIAGVGHNVFGWIGSTDRVLSFLPLAHIFELVFEFEAFYWNGILGYGSVKTLTNTSTRNCKGDLVEFKPTIMIGVAAVWETVRKAILEKISDLTPVLQKIFWSAYSMKEKSVPCTGFLSRMVFKKVRQATGGHLKYIMNGGSAISIDAQKFFSIVLCPMIIGYGLTETVANACVLEPDHFEYGIVGDLVGSVTAKLVDVKDLGYYAKNNQGELLLKGAPVCSEYYKNPIETAVSFTYDGWFRTGDIVEWTPKGQLKIIDRRKNLVKTLNGEYIALEKLESVYRSNSYVKNICVYADESRVKPVGIVVPNPGPLSKFAVKLRIMKKGEDIENYIHDKALRNAVFKEMIATAKSQGLVGIELLCGIVFFDEEWTPENGLVTSAQKLKRREILAAVKSEVERVYKENS